MSLILPFRMYGQTVVSKKRNVQPGCFKLKNWVHIDGVNFVNENVNVFVLIL